MKKLGVIVNPVAGMGGRVGLKGSDGIEILKKARKMGNKPEAPNRAIQALQIIARIKDQIEAITYPNEMGEDELILAGFNPTVIGSIKSKETTPEDTIKAAKDMLNAGADLILFAGGDGTARNIYSAVGNKVPTLGIPAGVKIHSGVYAINPRNAGIAATHFLENNIGSTIEAEVMDIDEEEFRKGRVSAKLYGYMMIPEARRHVQNVKSRSHSEASTLQGLAGDIIDGMKEDTLYIIGPGTTTRSIMERLELQNTLLGVDVIINKQVIASDVSEQVLWKLIDNKKAKIVVTAIGGQGHIFGRGNQQISPRIIKKVGKENIIVVATKNKLLSLQHRTLIVDTGELELDEKLCGYIRVVCGFRESVIYKVSS